MSLTFRNMTLGKKAGLLALLAILSLLALFALSSEADAALYCENSLGEGLSMYQYNDVNRTLSIRSGTDVNLTYFDPGMQFYKIGALTDPAITVQLNGGSFPIENVMIDSPSNVTLRLSSAVSSYPRTISTAGSQTLNLIVTGTHNLHYIGVNGTLNISGSGTINATAQNATGNTGNAITAGTLDVKDVTVNATGAPSDSNYGGNGVNVSGNMTITRATVNGTGNAETTTSSTVSGNANGIYVGGNANVSTGGTLTGKVNGQPNTASPYFAVTGNYSANGIYVVGTLTVAADGVKAEGTGGNNSINGTRTGNGVCAGSISAFGELKGTAGDATGTDANPGSESGNGIFIFGANASTVGAAVEGIAKDGYKRDKSGNGVYINGTIAEVQKNLTGTGGADTAGEASGNGVYIGGGITGDFRGMSEVKGTANGSHTGKTSGNGVYIGGGVTRQYGSISGTGATSSGDSGGNGVYIGGRSDIISQANTGYGAQIIGTAGANSGAMGGGNGVYIGGAFSSNAENVLRGTGTTGALTGARSGNGVYIADGGSATLGSGTEVTATAKAASAANRNSNNGLYVGGAVTMSAGASINAEAGVAASETNSANGVYANGAITMLGGANITVEKAGNGAKAISANGIYANGGITLTNGSWINIKKAGDGNGHVDTADKVANGIYAEGDFTITATTSSCSVIAYGGGNHNGRYSCNGIYAKNLTSNDTNDSLNHVTAKGGANVAGQFSGAGVVVGNIMDVFISPDLKVSGGTFASATTAVPAIYIAATRSVSDAEWTRWMTSTPAIGTPTRTGPSQVQFSVTCPSPLELSYKVLLSVNRAALTDEDEAGAGDIGPPPIGNVASSVKTKSVTGDGPYSVAPIIRHGDKSAAHLLMRMREVDNLRASPKNFYLKALGISEGTLSPAFDNITLNNKSYKASVSGSTSSIVIKPDQWFSPADWSAEPRYFDIKKFGEDTIKTDDDLNPSFNLNEGQNNFTITVYESRAAGAPSFTYELTIVRPTSISDNSRIFTDKTTETSITLGCTVGNVDTKQLSFEWFHVDATGKETPVGGKVKGDAGMTLNDTGLTPGTAYNYKVKVTNDSDPTLVKYLPATGFYTESTLKKLAITRLSATSPSGTEATIVADVEGLKSNYTYTYQFSRSTNPNGPFANVGSAQTVPNYSDHGLQPNTTYYYQCSVLEQQTGNSDQADAPVSILTGSGGSSTAGAPLISTNTTKLNVEEGSSSSHTFDVTGTTPITWSLTGTVPNGVTVDQNGKLSVSSNTPVGIYSINVKASNSIGTDTKEITLEVYKKGTTPSSPTPTGGTATPTPSGGTTTPTPTPYGMTPTPVGMTPTPTPTPTATSGAFTSDSITVSGTPSNNTMYVGDKMTLIPTLASGFTKATSKWEYDTTYFSLSASGDTATFTAKKAGTTTVLYTVTDTAGRTATKTINVTILPKAGLPQTGYDDRWPTLMLWIGALMFILVPFFGKGKRFAFGRSRHE